MHNLNIKLKKYDIIFTNQFIYKLFKFRRG